MAKVIKGTVYFTHTVPEDFDSLLNVREKLTTLFINLVNTKIYRKNLFTNVNKVIFYFDDGTESEIVINKINFYQGNNKLPKRINNLSDLETPVSAIEKFNSKIYSRLVEIWNLSNSYEELEFLLFHINDMAPLVEIELVNTEQMLLYKVSRPNSNVVPPIFGRNLTNILRRLSSSEFDLNNDDSLGILRGMVRELLEDNHPDYKDRETIVSFYLELLGYATKSVYKQNTNSEFGKIVLCLKKIKQGFDFINNHKDFSKFTSFIKYCFGYEITQTDYDYYDLMEMVYYHEFGHLFFGHINQKSSHVSNPNKMQESYANFFASIIFDSQLKSLQILIKTRFQPIEYQEPVLVKINESMKFLSNNYLPKCNLTSLTFYGLIAKERLDRQNNNGIHK
jgi:hypothetical protein